MTKLEKIIDDTSSYQLDVHVITMTRIHSTKVNGRFYKRNEVSNTRTIDTQTYLNHLSMIPLFKDKYKQAYTSAGYIITEISSNSPSDEERIVYKFEFEFKN